MKPVKNDASALRAEENPQQANPKHPNCYGNVSEFEWADAFYKKDKDSFLNIFHANVTQSASTSPYVNFGSEEVANTFSWASRFYDRCDFVAQATSGQIEFLEFDLQTTNNMHMTGMTALTKDIDGKVIKVFNGHRNLGETVLFTEHFVRGPRNKGIVSVFHDKALKKYGLRHLFPRNLAEITAVSEVSEIQYIQAFHDSSKEAFSAICDASVILSSSYVTDIVEGVDNVAQCMQLVSRFYEHCIFTTEARNNNKTYLLYKGRLRNGLVVSDGFLVLVRNSAGKIIKIFDNPIPLHAGTLLSAYLAENLRDKKFADRYFYNAQLFKTSVEKYSLNGVHGKNTRDLSSYKGFIAKFLITV